MRAALLAAAVVVALIAGLVLIGWAIQGDDFFAHEPFGPKPEGRP